MPSGGGARPDVLAVLQETLSNAARHARASRVDVAIDVSAGRVSVTVTDDGIGVAPDAARGGLANLRERAERHGGTFEIRPVGSHGTEVCWSVPLGH
jgi:signal transduction histidine kinase